VHRDLNIQQEGKIIIQKRNNRWLCLPGKASIQVRQEEQDKVNNNKIAVYSTQQKQHRISSKQKS
jgi:hypothetical protein